MAVDRINFVDSDTYTASTTVELGDWGQYLVDCRFILDVTAAATAAADTLNVRIQSSYNKDAVDPIWDDFASFTQVVGDGGAKQEILSWNRAPTPESEQRAPADGTLAAASVLQGPVGKWWRMDVTVVSDTAPSFTFSLIGDGMFYK